MGRVYYAIFAVMLLLSSCSAERVVIPTDSTVAPPSPSGSFPIATPTLSFLESPEPTALPTLTSPPTRPVFTPPTPDETPLDAVISFVDFPGNKAKDETAPDFSARLLRGGTFTLSEWRDSLLVLPAVVGCGPCMVNLEEIAQVYPAYQDTNLEVLILDIYAPDPPEVWQFYADLFPQVSFLWGVVDSMDFLMDYNLTGFGDVVLIGPEREILFWSSHILRAQEYQALFDLAIEASKTSSE